MRPSKFDLSEYPDLEISDDSISFSVSLPNDDVNPERLDTEIHQKIESLISALENQRKDVDGHNVKLPGAIESAVDRTREIAFAMTSAIESLGIPIKRSDEPAYIVPTKRRSRPSKPKPETSLGKSEPFLDSEEYAFILSVTRRMSLVIERNPSTFAGLDEETIRDHFLLQLNGHYEGKATGETFNSAGKTDILVREEDRNVFIGECKFWTGQKAFDSAIDQLLSYLSWRDCKCALLIFNRNKNSTDVWRKMHEAIEARTEHVKTIKHTNPDEDSQYVFSKPDDDGRELVITTQLFDVPAAKK